MVTGEILANFGFRLAETVHLKWNDVDFLSEVLLVPQGKG